MIGKLNEFLHQLNSKRDVVWQDIAISAVAVVYSWLFRVSSRGYSSQWCFLEIVWIDYVNTKRPVSPQRESRKRTKIWNKLNSITVNLCDWSSMKTKGIKWKSSLKKTTTNQQSTLIKNWKKEEYDRASTGRLGPRRRPRGASRLPH